MLNLKQGATRFAMQCQTRNLSEVDVSAQVTVVSGTIQNKNQA